MDASTVVRRNRFGVVFGAAVWVAVALLGLAAGVLTTVAAASLDGVSAEDYDSGNRFALAGLLLGTASIFPLISLALYGFGRLEEWSRPRSLALTLVGVVIAGATTVASWSV